MWTVTDHLLAAIVDQLNMLMWGLGGSKGSRPTPVPRPGSTSAEPQELTDEQRAYLEQFGPKAVSGGD